MSPLRLELPAPVIGRIKVLDELKGVAIILVILYHVGGVLSWANGPHGEAGVDMFVILSGVGLTLSSTSEGVGRFLARRFWRIFPAYWVVLTALLLCDAHFRGQHYTPADIALHYAGIQAWFGDRYAVSISDAFWFVTLIVSLYLAYAPMRRLLARPDKLLFAGAALSFAVATLCLRLNQPVEFGHFSVRFPGFFVGLLAGHLLKQGRLEIPLSMYLAGAFLLIFYAPYLLGYMFGGVWVGFALLVGYAFLLHPLLPAAVRSVLAFLGVRSLEIFLMHQVLIREYNVYVLQRFFPGVGITTWPLVAGICAGLAVTVALSSGLHALLRRLSSGRKVVVVEPEI